MILRKIGETLEARLLEQEDKLRPLTSLRRPNLENLGKEYNSKLEQDLLPIDRSSLIYAAPARDQLPPFNPNSLLKRKRSPSNLPQNHPKAPVLPGMVDWPFKSNRSGEDEVLKKSRMTIEEISKPERLKKLPFKVEMAKARFDLQVLQSVEVDRYPSEAELLKAKARKLAEIASPIFETIVQTSSPTVRGYI